LLWLVVEVGEAVKVVVVALEDFFLIPQL